MECGIFPNPNKLAAKIMVGHRNQLRCWRGARLLPNTRLSRDRGLTLLSICDHLSMELHPLQSFVTCVALHIAHEHARGV